MAGARAASAPDSHLAQFDAEQSGEESQWRDADDEPSVDLPRLRRPAPQSGGAARAVPRAVDRGTHRICRYGNSRRPARASSCPGRELDIARDLLAELAARTALSLRRGSRLSATRTAPRPRLSGGEAQRIRLAAQLGSNLQGVCYVLDEPTIGLHPRDNVALLDTLDRLRAKGNTLVVVEHDEETIRRADHVIDLGPGAGTRGGWLVAEGTAAELARLGNSATGPLSRGAAAAFTVPPPHDRPRDARRSRSPAPTLHNLRKVDARIPLGRLDRGHRVSRDPASRRWRATYC